MSEWFEIGRKLNRSAMQNRCVRNDSRSFSESLGQISVASERLLGVLNAAGLEEDGSTAASVSDHSNRMRGDLEAAKDVIRHIFEKELIKYYDGSDSMERARLAHLNAAIEMYTIVASSTHPFDGNHDGSNLENLASRIAHSLRKELVDIYQLTVNGSDRTTFTTAQRTALESAFLVKPNLNTAEKRALGKTCNLNPRQVEVWVRAPYRVWANSRQFSNRRTRKKRENRHTRRCRGAGPTADKITPEEKTA
jgi:Homeodomain